MKARDTVNDTIKDALRSSSIDAAVEERAFVLDSSTPDHQLGEIAPIARATFAASQPTEGDIRQVSLVMADLRGFTAYCERVSPGRTSRVLNEYLAAMVDVILSQQGLVQDFVGDGILGVFGAPRHNPEHAWNATLSALGMQLCIQHLARRWQREEATSFSMGVAVHSGEVFAGTVGSPRLMKYAVVGDPVNTVARLEELNRKLDTEIVMSGDTLALVRDRVNVRRRGFFSLRGRQHAVEVFEVIGQSDSKSP